MKKDENERKRAQELPRSSFFSWLLSKIQSSTFGVCIDTCWVLGDNGEKSFILSAFKGERNACNFIFSEKIVTSQKRFFFVSLHIAHKQNFLTKRRIPFSGKIGNDIFVWNSHKKEGRLSLRLASSQGRDGWLQ